MLTTISGYVQSLIGIVSSFVSAIFGTATSGNAVAGSLGALKELMLIGVTVSLGLVAVKFIRKIMWGN